MTEKDLEGLHTRGCATQAWPSDPWYSEECDCIVMEYRAIAEQATKMRLLLEEEHEAHHSGCCPDASELCHIGEVLGWGGDR